MTGPTGLSVDDPKFSYSGDYNYDYDFVCEEKSVSVDGGLFMADQSEEIDKLLNENDASSIDGSPTTGHIAASLDENSQESDPRKEEQKQPPRGKLDPPTFDDYICNPTSGCFELPTASEESVIASRINEYKKRRKQKKNHADSTLDPSLTDVASFSDDDCCANFDLNFGDDNDCLLFSSSPDLYSDQNSKFNKEVGTKDKRSRRKSEDSNKNDPLLKGQQLLCVHICANPNCDDANCRPPDLQSISKDREHMLKNSAFFYVTVALVLKREQEMRKDAEDSKNPMGRWDGSLLYRKCQELQTGRKSWKSNEDPLVITLHPVRTLAQNHVISPKFPWWQSWLTVCIRAYYNTGSLRVPKDCHGLEILLALEFFGILYTGPDQLIFDAPQVKSRCQRWSHYFTHRPSLAQWLVNRLHERQPESAELTSFIHRPSIFCTRPEAITTGYSLFVDEHEFPIEVFQAGLDVEDSGSFSGSSQKRKTMTSAALVQTFFVPSVENDDANSADSFYAPPHLIPAMMREDFVSYMQHVLPDVEVSFSLRKVQVVSIQQEAKTRKQEESVLSAVLVLSWNPSQRLKENKQVDPPAPNTDIQEEDQVSVFSASTSSSDSSEVSDGGTSFSAAPTDEMTFGTLLNDSHRAASPILQRSTKKKLRDAYIGQETSFYFQQDSDLESLNKTLDTTDDTSGSSKLVDGPTRRSGSMSTGSSMSSCEPKIFDTKVSTIQRQASQGESAHAWERSPSKPPSTSKPDHSEGAHQLGDDEKSQGSKKSTTNKFGYEVQHFQHGSVQADHVYADLYEGTTTVDSQHHNAPLPFVHASLHDQHSVTSSITRQPESFLSGLRNINMNGQTLQEDDDADNQCCRTKEETIKSPNQIHAQDTAWTNQDDGKMDKRIGVSSGDDHHEKKKKSKNKKKNRSIRDSTHETSLLDQADDPDKQTEETCQLLNDLYDFFIAEDKPSVVVVPPPAEATGMHRRQSSQSIGMESLSNQPEVMSWKTKHKNFLKASNDSFERKTTGVTLAVCGVETARRSKRQHTTHRSPGNWHVSPVYRAKTTLHEATVATSAHRKGNKFPNDLPEGVDEVENGIEVFHLPKSSPSTEQGTISPRHVERSRQVQSNDWIHDEEHPARAGRSRKHSIQSSDTAKHRRPGNSATDWQSSGKLSRGKKKRAESSSRKRGFFGLKLRPRK